MQVKYPDRIELANLPTRIERLEKLTEGINGPEIYIKRDDLTECGASGNKIRKLEFVVADAIKKGADTLITCGWVQSNHARATAIISAKLGLNAILVLRGEKPQEFRGNLFLDKLVGAEIKYITPEEYDKRVNEIMSNIANELQKNGHLGYSIPVGASTEIGIWGYIKAAEEIKEQLKKMDLKIDAIITAVGSGATCAGLLIGKKLFDLDAAIYGVNVDESEKYYKDVIYELIQRWEKVYDMNTQLSKEDIRIIDGYVGPGYSLTTKEQRETIKLVARKQGIILDPVYTGKAMHGLVQEIKKGKFKKGQKVLFIHTGGIFGLLAQGDNFEL